MLLSNYLFVIRCPDGWLNQKIVLAEREGQGIILELAKHRGKLKAEKKKPKCRCEHMVKNQAPSSYQMANSI